MINDHKEEFENDERFHELLESDVNFKSFEKFISKVCPNVNAHELLENLCNQKIGRNICKILLEDKENNWYNRACLINVLDKLLLSFRRF